MTVRLLRESPWYMFRHGIPGNESTPPLYYLMASMWSRLFGTGEFAVRSLTAIIGVATVAVAYPIGVELRSRRAGLILVLSGRREPAHACGFPRTLVPMRS